nr:hypothetical protein [Tanacetum cinerariifolium]
MDNKKHIVNQESFREMLHICTRLPGQSFVEPPFKEEILAFLRFLGHSGAIKRLTDVNINKLHQPWRSFVAIINKCLTGKSSGYDSLRGAIRRLTDVNINKLHQPWRSFVAIINKCLTEKSSGYDSLRLSQAQIIWGLYHKKNADFAYLMWEDFVYQVEHKDTKKNNEMYYPRDDHMFTTIKLVSKHQNMQQFGAMLPIELTNADIRNSDAYKEYYAVATGATPPKTKASVLKTRSSSDTTVTPPTTTAGPRLSTSAKGKQPATTSKAKKKGSDDEQASDEEEFIHPSLSTHAEEETRDEESFDPVPKTPENTDDEGNGRGIQMGDVHTTQEFEDSHVTLTPVNPDGQQQSSSVSSKFVTMAPLLVFASTLTPSTIATITTTHQAPTPSTTAPSTLLKDLPNFGSLFGFDHRLKTLEANFSEFTQMNQFARAVSSIPGIVERYMDQRMNEAVKVVVQIQSDRLRDEAQAENDEFLKTIDENMQKIIKEQVKEQVKIILDTYGDTVMLKRRRNDDADKDEEPFAGSDWGSKRRKEGNEPESASAPKEKATRSAGKSTQGTKSRQTSASESATAEEPMQTPFEMEEPSHLEFETGADDQPIVESSQHPECLVELEFFLEEVYKATTDQLDWVNLKGQQYPHNLLKPLPLIPNSRGRRVIPFDHFINNDLEYLRGGASSCKYTTSVTKTKAADYGHIKWIEDLFYDFAVNWESARDVYSKRRIIAVTELKIVEWHNYKHLDWITMRRDDDKLYKFKEGDLKRLRIQDIEDMLLLLVQEKLTNLTVEERFAFNVSLRMFTRSIVIQRHVEDLQLGVESYQKKLNLTKPNTYRFDLKHKEAYIAYSNPRGFIYQNKYKQNRLMRIDELHKFSDGTLTDVCTALDDCLKGIRMKYLPQSI